MKMSGTCPFCRAKTPTSDEEQIKYLRPWVKKKKAWAQSVMGDMYRDGKGVKQSYTMAIMLYELAIAQDDPVAMYDLARLYQTGCGVELSLDRAKELYGRAAELGDADAQYNLGLMYLNVYQDLANGTKMWIKSAAQGQEKAKRGLQKLKLQLKRKT